MKTFKTEHFEVTISNRDQDSVLSKDNFDRDYAIELVRNEGYNEFIHLNKREINLPIAEMIESEDEQSILDAIDAVIRNREWSLEELKRKARAFKYETKIDTEVYEAELGILEPSW